MKTTFEIDMNDVTEVKNLRNLLSLQLKQLGYEEETEDDGEELQRPNIEYLREFVKWASDNQKEVLRYMKAHPGNVSSYELKQALPFLAPQGALSGVFRSGRWIKLTRGSKTGFPFVQVEWDRENGWGIYRGLTAEEAAVLEV
ncbi:hypothetical protein [Tumebacillus flagellatus]|uniref:Uncharacterized protein n=1 Tax=Tumebacillus flagellatus TaxID=1157490 RepID=A0A074LVQ7_9BACL|nr:hypothetical protein [Tumebacillus flagellatus]KEO84098.1 hypothetical protein EL26_06440 [Tumebacillus flagellatus]